MVLSKSKAFGLMYLMVTEVRSTERFISCHQRITEVLDQRDKLVEERKAMLENKLKKVSYGTCC
jgi:hypothetical protein